MTRLLLEKNSYHSARISANKQFLYGEKTLLHLCTLGFDEILKYMEEHNYEKSIDLNYTRFEGFYLIERLLNDHASNIYQKIIETAPKRNKTFLNQYYLKYQIHNLMVYIRSKLVDEKNYKAYLIGSLRKKEKFARAFSMELDDGVRYLCSKLELDATIVLEKMHQDLFSLENYLYHHYYSSLAKMQLKYNNRDEKIFLRYLQGYVDLLNARTLLKLISNQEPANTQQASSQQQKALHDQFRELFLQGGTLSYELFSRIDLTKKETTQEIHALINVSDDEELDETINAHKRSSNTLFSKVRFSSPFYALKFLFTLESELAQLRIILKAKYSKLDDQQVRELAGLTSAKNTTSTRNTKNLATKNTLKKQVTK